MSNKVFLIALTAIIIAASGIFILAKSRPADIQSNVGIVSSVITPAISSNIKSSSSSSLVVSSSVTASSVVETSKVETPPVVESKPVVQAPVYVAPQPVTPTPQSGKGNEVVDSTIQAPVANLSYNLNYKFSNNNRSGGLEISQNDSNFLEENIGDIADYYFNQVKNLFPDKNKIVTVYNFQKYDSSNYYIEMGMRVNPISGEGSISYPNRKIYKFARINEHDGNFEEVYGYLFSNKPIQENVSSPEFSLPNEVAPNIVYSD